MWQSSKSWAQPAIYETPQAAAADPDFSLQGEYVGPQRAMQAVALGDGEFDIALFEGGLPGAGWDRSPPRRLNIDGEQLQDLLEANALQRVERASPTLGMQPPPGAVVLFDGTPHALEEHWQPGARISDDGLLMQGATSRDLFENYKLHLEFRTPYMPQARGQGRGNSGLYHQGRYETQILDSFGLEGKMNETGGIYSIRDPDLNMCLPPLAWQTYDVEYVAAQYDAQGMKQANARLTVRLNGVLVQSDVELPHSTTAAPLAEGPQPGPIFLQDHGNPVRFRNIWVVPRDLEREARRPRVVGFERFYSQTEPSAAGGHLLIGELGCAACHDVAEAGLPRKQAPLLGAVGSRVRADYLLAFIQEPHAVKAGTTMPDVLGRLDADSRQAAAAAITNFLLSTGSSIDRIGDPRAVRRGEQLFHSIGCTACHAPQNAATAADLATSVPLGDLGAKYTLDALTGFLQNPHEVRPSGRMPAFGLGQDQANDLATYLLRETIIGRGAMNMQAAFYEGDWDQLPDLDQLQPSAETETYGLDILASGKNERFAARFDSFFKVPRDATYRVHLGSDDGSRLMIDGSLVVGNDGVHPFSFKTVRVDLSAGVHQVRVEYFEKGGEERLELEIEGGGLPRTSLATLATLDPAGTPAQPEINRSFEFQAELVDRGRELFTSVGCAACHPLKSLEPVSRQPAQALAAADVQRGCLADTPSPTAPNFEFSDSQRAAIRLAINQLRAGRPNLDDAEHVHLTMATMNCYACHRRGAVGGPEASRDAFFGTTMKEMGDEGRLPPPLTGVGDKLRENYLREILDKGADERPYMLVNMPGFGHDNLPGLVDRLVRLDQQSTADIQAASGAEAKVKSDGRLLVGEKGLSCVKCHVFGGRGAPGIQAIDLQRMTSRLREDWFHRYLMSPTTYRPGTRMPASFPEGKSVLPELYDGQPSRQIDAMWRYLSDGARARQPIGVEQQMIELVAGRRPTIYRNFVEGLSPRAIAVGYPEQGNLAWDAGRLSLSMLWKGAFIDASKHWVGRGPGTQGPLGDEPITLESDVPLARLDAPQSSWPTGSAHELGYRFLGYRLNADGQPTFRYRLGDVLVEDTPYPLVEDGRFAGFRREFTLSGPTTTDLYWRVARGQNIVRQAAGAYRIDDRWSTKVDVVPALRTSAGSSELVAPVPVAAGTPTKLTQFIRW